MGSLAVQAVSEPAPMGIGPTPMRSFKYWKLIAFLSWFGQAACSAPPQAEAPEVELSFLRDENRRLTRELEEQRARAKDEGTCEVPAPGSTPSSPESDEPTELDVAPESPQEDLVVASAGPVTAMPPLPVVKLSPDSGATQAAEGISIRESVPDDEEFGPRGTRPVLKVQGKHEAWVFHRPIEDDETQSSGPDEGIRVVPSPSHSEAESH